MHEWISATKHRPKIGQKCIFYYVMERFDGSILRDMRMGYYLKYMHDNRKHVFSSEKTRYSEDLNIGNEDWPITHWMPLPNIPIERSLRNA